MKMARNLSATAFLLLNFKTFTNQNLFRLKFRSFIVKVLKICFHFAICSDDEASHGVHITKMGSDDVHLHIHEEHGTGGHWCAKLIFFSLMAVLMGLVFLIILENRGISDGKSEIFHFD